MTSANRRFKEAVYEQFARIGKAVANPCRLELLDLLCQGPRTVEVLAREAGQSVANASQHLRILRTARLVETEKNGLFVTYRLADDEVCAFFQTMRHLAESRLAEIERVTRTFLEERGAMEPVDTAALLDRIRRGEVTVLDVRPPEEYRTGHISGAISVPLGELERRVSQLPKRREIVAYCRGPYCVMALEAVELLRAKGFRAFRLEDGVHEWRARGFGIETGDPAGRVTRRARRAAS